MKFLKDDTPDAELDIDRVADGVELSNNIVKRPGTYRVYTYSHIYISSILDFCPRAEAIGTLLGLKKSFNLFHANAHMMNFGHAFHYWVQNNPDLFFEKDKFLGYWKCLACGNSRRFGKKPTTPCEKCGAKAQATVYDEYKLKYASPYRISGKVDGIIQVSDSKFRILDIKTDGAKEEIVVARPADYAQVASYMYFSQFDESDNKLPVEIDQDVGYVMYFRKVMNPKAPHKTFKVRPTDRLLNPIKERVSAFTKAVDTGILPEPYESCLSSAWNDKKAKNCLRLDECRDMYSRRVSAIDKCS
jgi:hypothetical protein